MSLLASVSKCLNLQSSGLLVHLLVLFMGMVMVLAMPNREAQSSVVRRHSPLRLFSGSTINGTSTTIVPRGKFSEKTSWISPLTVLIVLVIAIAMILIFLGASRKKSNTKAPKTKDRKHTRTKNDKNRPQERSNDSPVGMPSTEPPSPTKTPVSPNRVRSPSKNLTAVVTKFNQILLTFNRINFVNLEKRQRIEYYQLNADLKKVKIQLKEAQKKDNKHKNGQDYGKLHKKLTDMALVVNQLNAGGGARPVNMQVGTVQTAKGRDKHGNRKADRTEEPKTRVKKVVDHVPEPTQSELKSSSGVEDEESSVIVMPQLRPTSKDDGSVDESGEQEDK